ncbi:putative glycoside hydrolase [Sutcliffiella cohnii]|uniref:GTP-binding protein n=1 Tax=Sutcliffiella cohnii TaxID=33932 RepID=A0A223KML9_9BACI|nr:putative glycoside hydrolase [Sutcliffiella cohnii]AST90604.1 GTP-binding protein [Sutcliffiella cohnii]MED4016893.1 putative glycoside hydrolase [Sutcliffiella cohnii]
MEKKLSIVVSIVLLLTLFPIKNAADEVKRITTHQLKPIMTQLREIPNDMERFAFDSGHVFEYPDAVRGIYVTGHSAGGSRFESLLDLMDTTDLNAMVIDIKDDHGYLTYLPDEGSPFSNIAQPYIKDPHQMIATLEEKQIYPIGRIVVFKDSVIAEMKPEWSFLDGDKVWLNRRGEAFVNPFLKEVWDYNIDIAIEAAKLGFQEIQFDYVRFPEGFEKRDEDLKYSLGDYEDMELDNVQKRVEAVTNFVEYAKERLEPYNVQVSVDIFGYTATLPEAPGIGQNFSKISEHVDVISSMIYPSHWTAYFGIPKPDLEPYKLVAEYAKLENAKLDQLENRPISRPWIQDFTATWLGAGNYIPYGKAEVEAQIRALNDNGIHEFLLWNAGNRYTSGVNYKPNND